MQLNETALFARHTHCRSVDKPRSRGCMNASRSCHQIADGEKPVARRAVVAQFQHALSGLKLPCRSPTTKSRPAVFLFEASHGYERLLHVFYRIEVDMSRRRAAEGPLCEIRTVAPADVRAEVNEAGQVGLFCCPDRHEVRD
jgi:hypothetical protein